MGTNKHKIINDPIYGFITLPSALIYDLINHPYFQRLRYIKQLGLTHLVYPGALHTRFHHAIGAMHLMQEALQNLKLKGISITPAEHEATLAAILLHDIGHGPFSHALEHSLVHGISHESISSMIISQLDKQFKGRLKLCHHIFNNTYSKKPFLHQLVSSQLDMDRLDYLKRDSFFTGVSEGVISSDRIIKMLHVKKGKLVVEHKAIYSIEKFLVARRLMYWQVYFHKTVVGAEILLVHILKRAKHLRQKHMPLFCTPALDLFLKHNFNLSHFKTQAPLLETFAQLDDHDVMTSIKIWKSHSDVVLSRLCQQLLNRDLLRVDVLHKAPSPASIQRKRLDVSKKYKISLTDANYFVQVHHVNNHAYRADAFNINILYTDGHLRDVTEASDLLNLKSLSKTVHKYYFCYPK